MMLERKIRYRMGPGVRNPCRVGPHSLPEAGREDAPGVRAPRLVGCGVWLLGRRLPGEQGLLGRREIGCVSLPEIRI